MGLRGSVVQVITRSGVYVEGRVNTKYVGFTEGKEQSIDSRGACPK